MGFLIYPIPFTPCNPITRGKSPSPYQGEGEDKVKGADAPFNLPDYSFRVRKVKEKQRPFSKTNSLSPFQGG